MWQEIEVMKVGKQVSMVKVGRLSAVSMGGRLAVIGATTAEEVEMMGSIWNDAVAEAKSKK